MEDILASIRRILSEEETQEQAAAPPPAAPAAPAPKAQEWAQQAKTEAPGGQAKEWGNKQAEGVGGKTEAWAEKPIEAPGAAKEAWHDKPAEGTGGQQGMMNKAPEGPGGKQEAWAEKPIEAPGAAKESWQDKPEGPGGKQEAWSEEPVAAPGGKQEEWHDKPAAAGQGKSWGEQEQRRRAPAAEPDGDVLVLTEDMLAEDDLELADAGPGGMRNMNPMDEGEGMPAGTSALAQLKRVVAQRSQSMASDRNLALGNGGITIEQLVREILNDLLRDWINQHLPPMVDRIAKREIQKLVSGAE